MGGEEERDGGCAIRAIAMRVRLGARERCMERTAWATMATATSSRPCRARRAIGSGEEAVAKGEGEHEQRGGKGEAEPGGEAAGKAAAEEAEGEAGLAAGGAGEGLGERNDFGVGFFAAPGAAVDELALEVAEVGDGAAEAGAAEAQEDAGRSRSRRARGLRRHGGGYAGTACGR